MSLLASGKITYKGWFWQRIDISQITFYLSAMGSLPDISIHSSKHITALTLLGSAISLWLGLQILESQGPGHIFVGVLEILGFTYFVIVAIWTQMRIKIRIRGDGVEIFGYLKTTKIRWNEVKSDFEFGLDGSKESKLQFRYLALQRQRPEKGRSPVKVKTISKLYCVVSNDLKDVLNLYRKTAAIS